MFELSPTDEGVDSIVLIQASVLHDTLVMVDRADIVVCIKTQAIFELCTF